MSPSVLTGTDDGGIELAIEAGAIDRQFSALIGRLDPHAAPEVMRAARAICHATRAGHVCVELANLAGFAYASGESQAWPEPRRLTELLRASAAVGAPGDFAPLILDRAGRLYLQRYWQYETDVAADLRVRARRFEPLEPQRALPVLDALFPRAGAEIDWQRVAAAAVLRQQFLVISGGPGTGKTSTVVRALVALLRYTAQPLRIAVAAPTGLGAARLEQALRTGRRDIVLTSVEAALLPQSATTLHRLLGARRHSAYFAHDARHPLPVDVLVIDEASMIDLALMAKTLVALPACARLILLGDKDQLASVEAGAVLGSLCADAGPFGGVQSAEIAQVCPGLPSSSAAAAYADNVVVLGKSYRFDEASGIARLARAINAGDADCAWELLSDATGGHLARGSVPGGSLLDAEQRDYLIRGYSPYLLQCQAHRDPAAILAAFGAFRVLCAHRGGRAGALEVNSVLEAELGERGLIEPDRDWYPGRPIVIQDNDHELGIYNGDIGVALARTDDPDRVSVVFMHPNGEVRQLAPARLPRYESGFALTVHKAQGSEYDRVLLVLPQLPSPIVTRELLYTALTRARVGFEIWTDESVFRDGVRRRVMRGSALAARLRDSE